MNFNQAKLILLTVGLGLRDSIGCFKNVYDVCSSEYTSSSKKPQKTTVPAQHLTTLEYRRLKEKKRMALSEELTEEDKTSNSLLNRLQNFFKFFGENKLLNRLLWCSFWNGGLFLLSILIFSHILIPGFNFLFASVFSSYPGIMALLQNIAFFISWLFGIIWILPLFLLSKIANGLWFQEIADAAFKRTHGKPRHIPGFGNLISDVLFSIIMESLFLVQAYLFNNVPIIPVIGSIIYMTHLCLLYSLYSFEYKWFNCGWDVKRRVEMIEDNWPYYVGFGLPLMLITFIPDSFIISGCLFSFVFPFFLIGAQCTEAAELHSNVPKYRFFELSRYLSQTIFRLFNNITQDKLKLT